MGEIYGWGPGEVNKLTLFQLAVYLGAITPEHGRVKISPEDAKAIIGHRQAKRAGLK